MTRNGFLGSILTLLIELIATALFCSSARAKERFDNIVGVRGLGMGGAQISAVNDETSILINPAALGKLRDSFATLVDPEVDVNNLASQSFTGSGADAAQEPQALLNYLNANPNRYYYARAQLMPSFVLQNFGIGAYATEFHAAQVDQNTNKMNLNWRRDTGGVIAYNFKFWEGRIKIGAAVRLFDRIEVKDVDIDTTTTGLRLQDIANEGGAVAADGGIVLTAPITYLPTLTAVVRDIGQTNFDVGKGLNYDTPGRPNGQRQTVDLGFGLYPILGKRYRLTIAGEFRDATSTDTEDQLDSMRRMHVGAELNIADVIFIRGGMNQRYWTAGLEISTEHFQFQAASYGQEIGISTATQEDRRYVGKIAIRF